MINELTRLRPDPARQSRTMARCHATLARRRRRIESAAPRPNSARLVLERAFVAGFCVVYLVVMAGNIILLFFSS